MTNQPCSSFELRASFVIPVSSFGFFPLLPHGTARPPTVSAVGCGIGL